MQTGHTFEDIQRPDGDVGTLKRHGTPTDRVERQASPLPHRAGRVNGGLPLCANHPIRHLTNGLYLTGASDQE